MGQTSNTDSVPCKPLPPVRTVIQRTLRSSVPMVAMALPYAISNGHVRDIRNSYLSSFHNRYDDFLQFVPLLSQVGMHLSGIKGHSKDFNELLTSDAIGFGLMMTSIALTKHLTHVKRPDNSSSNSFPSGHTAMAFYSATVLHIEYGKRYPWLSLAGYIAAGGVGAGRIMNNRHWIGDVVVGAAVGVVSAEIGYWLSSLLHRRSHIYEEVLCCFPNTDLRIYFPWSIGLLKGEHNRSFGIGLRWCYDSKYFIALEGLLEGHYTHDMNKKHVFTRNQDLRIGWGRKLRLNEHNLSMDLGAFAGISTDGSIYPALQITPRIELTNRLSWQVNLGYEYHSKKRKAYTEKEELSFSIPSWRLGTAIEFRL